MGGVFLEIAKSGEDGCFKILFFGNKGASHSVVFNIVPDELIGIEFWAVGRQEEKAQMLRGILKILPDPSRSV